MTEAGYLMGLVTRLATHSSAQSSLSGANGPESSSQWPHITDIKCNWGWISPGYWAFQLNSRYVHGSIYEALHTMTWRMERMQSTKRIRNLFSWPWVCALPSDVSCPDKRLRKPGRDLSCAARCPGSGARILRAHFEWSASNLWRTRAINKPGGSSCL